MIPKVLEIACFNLQSALIAQVSGADRIELCEHYRSGGLTPSYKLIQEARQKVQIPLHVIIRPHARNFHCSGTELKTMANDILFCKEHQVEGIVFGILEGDKVDKVSCKELIDLARPMSVTFHRAVDHCVDLHKAFEALVELGVDRVLTSGGKGNVVNNVEHLKKLQAAFGKQISIMPGGGIRSSNLAEIMKSSCLEYHSAALDQHAQNADAEEIRRLKNQLTQAV